VSVIYLPCTELPKPLPAIHHHHHAVHWRHFPQQPCACAGGGEGGLWGGSGFGQMGAGGLLSASSVAYSPVYVEHVVARVPEAGTLLMVAIGLACLFGFVLRRKA